MPRPDFDAMFSFWTELLGERGLPQVVQWVFHEDVARRPPTIRGFSFAFRPRPFAEADQIARFAWARLDPKYPLAIVACAVLKGSVITGLQGDVWTADGDVYRDDWNVYFDAKDHIASVGEIVIDEGRWEFLRKEQPSYSSEFDYLVSTHALQRDFGYRGQV
jgi:hypothetical protein